MSAFNIEAICCEFFSVLLQDVDEPMHTIVRGMLNDPKTWESHEKLKQIACRLLVASCKDNVKALFNSFCALLDGRYSNTDLQNFLAHLEASRVVRKSIGKQLIQLNQQNKKLTERLQYQIIDDRRLQEHVYNAESKISTIPNERTVLKSIECSYSNTTKIFADLTYLIDQQQRIARHSMIRP